MSEQLNQFNHPLRALVEDHLKKLGIDLISAKRTTPDCFLYLYRGLSGTTVVLRLYNHRNDDQELKSWFCFEFGVGYLPGKQAGPCLQDLSYKMYNCFIPIRPMISTDGDERLLVLMVRAEVAAFNPQYIPTLMDATESLADEIRVLLEAVAVGDKAA